MKDGFTRTRQLTPAEKEKRCQDRENREPTVLASTVHPNYCIGTIASTMNLSSTRSAPLRIEAPDNQRWPDRSPGLPRPRLWRQSNRMQGGRSSDPGKDSRISASDSLTLALCDACARKRADPCSPAPVWLFLPVHVSASFSILPDGRKRLG